MHRQAAIPRETLPAFTWEPPWYAPSPEPAPGTSRVEGSPPAEAPDLTTVVLQAPDGGNSSLIRAALEILVRAAECASPAGVAGGRIMPDGSIRMRLPGRAFRAFREGVVACHLGRLGISLQTVSAV